MRFTDSEDGTQVDLVPPFFEHIGPPGGDVQAGFTIGWKAVLGRFAAVAEGPDKDT